MHDDGLKFCANALCTCHVCFCRCLSMSQLLSAHAPELLLCMSAELMLVQILLHVVIRGGLALSHASSICLGIAYVLPFVLFGLTTFVWLIVCSSPADWTPLRSLLSMFSCRPLCWTKPALGPGPCPASLSSVPTPDDKDTNYLLEQRTFIACSSWDSTWSSKEEVFIQLSAFPIFQCCLLAARPLQGKLCSQQLQCISGAFVRFMYPVCRL